MRESISPMADQHHCSVHATCARVRVKTNDKVLLAIWSCSLSDFEINFGLDFVMMIRLWAISRQNLWTIFEIPKVVPLDENRAPNDCVLMAWMNQQKSISIGNRGIRWNEMRPLRVDTHRIESNASILFPCVCLCDTKSTKFLSNVTADNIQSSIS